MAVFSAKNAQILLGATSILSGKWSVSLKTDENDVTTFSSNGYREVIGGIVSADISVDALWDGAANPTAIPPNIKPGSELITGLKLYLDTVNLPTSFWNFPKILIASVDVEAEVRGVLRYSFTAMSHGTFSYPT